MMIETSLTRRHVLAGTAATAGGLAIAPGVAMAAPPFNISLSVPTGISGSANNTLPVGYITQFSFYGVVFRPDIAVVNPMTPSQRVSVVGVLSAMTV